MGRLETAGIIVAVLAVIAVLVWFIRHVLNAPAIQPDHPDEPRYLGRLLQQDNTGCRCGKCYLGNDRDEVPPTPMPAGWFNGTDLADGFWRTNPTTPLQISGIPRLNRNTRHNEWAKRNINGGRRAA